MLSTTTNIVWVVLVANTMVHRAQGAKASKTIAAVAGILAMSPSQPIDINNIRKTNKSTIFDIVWSGLTRTQC